jgi:hypothetical protein
VRPVQRNIVAGAIVIALHLVLALMFARGLVVRRVIEAEELSGWLFLLPPPTQPKKLTNTVRDSPRSTVVNRTQGVNTATENPVTTTAITLPSVDWQELGAAVAEDRTRRHFEARNQEEAMIGKRSDGMKEPNVPSLFPAPQHRHGDSEQRDGNALITWIDERCFVTNQLHPSMSLDPTGPRMVCKDRHKADTDLFNHLKPSYLESLPKPLEPRQ